MFLLPRKPKLFVLLAKKLETFDFSERIIAKMLARVLIWPKNPKSCQEMQDNPTNLKNLERKLKFQTLGRQTDSCIRLIFRFFSRCPMFFFSSPVFKLVDSVDVIVAYFELKGCRFDTGYYFPTDTSWVLIKKGRPATTGIFAPCHFCEGF